MKQRLDLGLQPSTVNEILMKRIIEIKINNILYSKSNYISHFDIQNFYRFIKKNIEYITYIKYSIKNPMGEINYLTIFLENKKVHNYYNYARTFDKEKYYYINGKHISYDDWLNDIERIKYIRSEKLKNILHE